MTKTVHPYCRICGWRRGGQDSWNGTACKCGLTDPPLPDPDPLYPWPGPDSPDPKKKTGRD